MPWCRIASTSSAVSPPAAIDTVSVPPAKSAESMSVTVVLPPWSTTTAAAPGVTVVLSPASPAMDGTVEVSSTMSVADSARS